MDSIEFNKIAAAILIALLIVKGADLVSENLIHPKMLKENVFQIEGVAASSPSNGESGKKGPAPIEPLLVSANTQNGAVVFKKCMSCHTIEKGGPNKIGPDLYGIVGAPKAKHPGYTYSAAMEKKGGIWSYDDLNVYLYSPRDFVPGTKMSFAGIKDDKERADLIAYLRQQNDAPPPLPKPITSPPPTPAAAPPVPATAVPPTKPAAAPAPAPTVPAKSAAPPVPATAPPVKPAAPVAAPAPAATPPAPAPAAPPKPTAPPVPAIAPPAKPAAPVTPSAPAATPPAPAPTAPAKSAATPVPTTAPPVKPAAPVASPTPAATPPAPAPTAPVKSAASPVPATAPPAKPAK